MSQHRCAAEGCEALTSATYCYEHRHLSRRAQRRAAEEAAKRRKRCGWGGAKDDPAPCPEAPMEGRHWLCARHAAIVGTYKSGRRRATRPAAPGAVRRVEPDPPRQRPGPAAAKAAAPQRPAHNACVDCGRPAYAPRAQRCLEHLRVHIAALQRGYRERDAGGRKPCAISGCDELTLGTWCQRHKHPATRRRLAAEAQAAA